MRLAVIGASARAAAFSALDAGYEVVTADLFADADLAARCPVWRVTGWPAGFAHWLAVQRVDAWLYTGGLENYPLLIDRLAACQKLFGVPGNVLQVVRCPAQLSAELARRNCAFPETHTEVPDDTCMSGWLLKSRTSAGGLGVREWAGKSLDNPQLYLQRKIHGRAIAAAYVASGGSAKVLGVTEQLIGREWTRAAPFQYAGSIGPMELPSNTRAAIRQAGEALVGAFDLVGLFGIDFVVDAEGTPWVVDVNPRYTASMEVVERMTGRSMIAAHVEACTTGRQVEYASSSNQRYIGKAYLFANRDAVAGDLSSPGRADVPAVGTRIQQGHPVATLLVNQDCYDDVETSLRNAVSQLESELYR